MIRHRTQCESAEFLPTPATAQAFKLAAECYAALGDANRTSEFCNRAVSIAGQTGKKQIRKESGQYSENRFALDAADKLSAEYIDEIVRTAERYGHKAVPSFLRPVQ